MMRITLIVLAFLLVCSCCACLAEDPVSPLFRSRHEATMKDWERESAVEVSGGDAPVLTPASLNPFSFCVGSACMGSYCAGSLCISSECLGSGCVGSTCIGSGCAASLCAASGCVGSICGGSACVGPTLCIKVCGDDTGGTIVLDPNYSNLTYTWGPCRDR
jgi:hypothetical protein